MDLLYWLLAAPAPGSSKPSHVPSRISSAGSLQFFKSERKPVEADDATNCLSCAYEPSCQFSAKRIYTGSDLKGRQQTHFSKIVAPEIEDYIAAGDSEGGRKALMKQLAEDYPANTSANEIASRNWFGRCVFECDNDVCDNQTVTLSWESDPIASEGDSRLQALAGRGSKTATLHMVAFTEKICTRYTNIYGTTGEIYADSSCITVNDFRTCERTVHYPFIPPGGGHGDGDAGLTRQFVLAVDQVKNHGCEVVKAQKEYIGCSLEDIIMSHSLVFAAEQARKNRVVLDFPNWWTQEVTSKLNS